MSSRAIVAALLCAAPALSQGNAVPGMDALVYNVTDIAYYGRQGAAYPNGEAAFMVGHSYCNSGTVDIPWVATSGGVMVDTYPKIAFLLARESNGRMVQITGKSFMKHSTAVFNFGSGPCAPCQAGPSQTFRRGCSDTYGSGTNASQSNLGPTTEVNPWLGTWASVGSYFDRGDPPVVGAAATDGVKSLNGTMVSAFGPVKNRMVVRESELVAGSTYYGQVHLMIQGEPAANRGTNVQSRPMSISWNGSSWSASALGASTTGSVLTQWQGASHNIGGNGNDDGRFLVASKVTGPVGGVWHYEYAIHNLDNDRGGASLRIPVDAAATVTNAGFHDIDGDPLNNWIYSRTANEILFQSSGNNPLDWNTIYNCWFDCTVAPSYGFASIDEARIGPGALSVQVEAEVPSGIPMARKEKVGHSCGACSSALYEFFPAAGGFDLNGRSMTLTLNNGAYTAVETPVTFVTPAGSTLSMSDESEVPVQLPFSLPYPGGSTTQLRVCSNGFISPAGSNGTTYNPTTGEFLMGQPRWAALWHDLTPNATNGVRVDSSPTRVTVTWNGVPNFSAGGANTFQYQFYPNGTVHILWQSITAAGNAYLVGWSPGGVQQDPGSRDLSATLPIPYELCAGYFAGLDFDASARPVLGTTIQWVTSNIPANTDLGFVLKSVTRLSPPVDLTFIGMTGCEAHIANWWSDVFVLPPSTVQLPEIIPNDVTLIGVQLIGQVVTHSPPLTPMGLIASNAVVLTLGL